MTGHTKGPWLTSGRLVYALNEKGTNSFSAYFEGENGEANAMVSAAAPDLLELAKAVAAQYDTESVVHEGSVEYRLGSMARAAISKAEGQ